MNYQFSYNIEVNFNLTQEEFDLVTLAIQNGERKVEGTQGHFWAGNVNRYNWYLEDLKNKVKDINIFPLVATFRQIDTVIMKSLEKYINYPNKNQELAKQLFNNMMELLKNINKKHQEIHCKEILEL